MKIPLVCLFLLCFVNFLPAQTEETIIGWHRFTGKVEDAKGLPIAGINLYIQKGDRSRTFATDIKGEFNAGLQPGRYEITVNKAWSASFRAFISITGGGPNPDKVVFVLDPTRTCCALSDGKPFPKPLVLPKPPFPPAARAVRASGEVEVAVTIESDGKVSSASAISGHPLLRAASVVAARSATFESYEESSQKRELVLTYVYLASDDSNKNAIRYSNSYRIEVVTSPPTIYH